MKSITWIGTLLACMVMPGLAGFALGDELPGLKYVETASGAKSARTRELVQWTHTRLVFNKELRRVAVGQEEILQVEVLGGQEVLALARQVGRTSIIAWYTDDTSETFLFSVVQDLGVLRRALREIHPKIRGQIAPDRAALILRGKVPTMKFRVAAESAARSYLEAGSKGPTPRSSVVLQTPGVDAQMSDSNLRVGATQHSGEETAAIINLIQVETMPDTAEQKIQAAIKDIGGRDVTIKRVQRGDVPDDALDTLTLNGTVENQVVLSRILNVVSRLFAASDSQAGQETAVQAITDEAGAIISARNRSGGGTSGSLINGGASLGAPGNEVAANIARSKLVSIAGGRILSMIEVRDLPQVRVSVQMYEVNRAQLRSWRPDVSVSTNDYNSGGRFGLNAAGPTGESGVEAALQALGGALTSNFQISTGKLAFDLLFSLLEEEGISRTLSRPTLTVLAGETALFRAGGEVPVPSAFAPSGLSAGDQVGPNASGVFSGTQFKAFGVELKVRAMVDESDRITLDVQPTVSLPDTLLTQQIAGSTGSNLNTSAFNVRSIDTSARLRDGQPMIIGGLVTRDLNDNHAFTPGLNAVPVLGKLAESSTDGDTDRELIIIVTPTLVREPRHDASLWQFPNRQELLSATHPELTHSSRSQSDKLWSKEP